MRRKEGLKGKGILPRMKPEKKKLTNAPIAICEVSTLLQAAEGGGKQGVWKGGQDGGRGGSREGWREGEREGRREGGISGRRRQPGNGKG